MLFSKNILSKNYRRDMEKLFIDERWFRLKRKYRIWKKQLRIVMFNNDTNS